MPVPLIDIHPHVISDDTARYPKAPLGGVQSVWSQERPVTWEQLRAAMVTAGVNKAAVVQASTVYGHDNRYLADCVHQASDIITGVCSVDFRDPNVVDDIRHWIEGEGLSGVRLFTTGSTMPNQATWLDAPETKKAWAYVAETRIPVCLQLSEPALPQLERLLQEFGGLRVVLDHVARFDFSSGPPYSAKPVYRLARYPGLHLKVTSNTLLSAEKSEGGSGAALGELIANFGSERIAWGSNFPATEGTLTDLVALLDRATEGLSDEDRANVRHRTALSLYPKLSGGDFAAEQGGRQAASPGRSTDAR